MSNSLTRYYRTKFPKESSGLTDDDITLKYAQLADQFKASGSDIFTQYPDFAEDLQRIQKQQIEDSVTAGDYAKQAYKSLAAGVTGTVADIIRAPAKILGRVTEGDIDLDPSIKGASDAIVGAITPDIDPEKRPVLEDSFLASSVPQGLGSAAGFLIPGGAFSKVAKVAKIARTAEEAATIGTALAGASAGFTEQYDRAKAKGATDSQAMQSGFLGGIVGLSEAAPLGKFLERIQGVAPAAATGIKQMLLQAAPETLEETLQEGFQSAAGDAIAKNIIAYDPNLESFKDIGNDAAAGGASGLVFSLLTQAIGRVRTRSASVPSTGKDAPGPAPANETLKSGEQHQPGTASDVLSIQYDVEDKALNDLVARTVTDGSDAVAPEVASLSPDALRLYTVKLGEARLRQNVERQKAADTVTEEDKAKAAADAEALVGQIAPSTEAPQAPTDAAPPLGASPAPSEAEVTNQPKESNAVQQQAADEVGVRDEAAVRPGMGGQDQVAEKPAEVGQGQGQEGQEQVATAGAVVASGETVPLGKRISDQVTKFHSENDGADSREAVLAQVKAIEDQATQFGKIRAVLAEADARRKAEQKKAEESGEDVNIPVLTVAEMKKLLALDDKSTSSAKVMVALEKVSSGKGGLEVLKRLESSIASLQGDALNRSVKAREKAGGLDQEGGKLTPEQLLGWEAVNYAPADGGPGFFTVEDGSDKAQQLSALARGFDAAAGEAEKSKAADDIGNLLATGSLVRGSRGQTKRMAVWSGPDGRIAVMSAFDQSTSKGGKENPDKAWRYSVGQQNKSAAAKGDQVGAGMVGVRTLLNAGWRPVGAIALTSPRGRVALSFANIGEFNSFIGTAAKEQQANIKARFSEFESSGSVNKPDLGDRSVLDAVAEKDTMGRVRDEAGAGERTTSEETEEKNLRVEAFKLMQQNPALSAKIVEFWDANPDSTPYQVVDKFIAEFSALIDENAELKKTLFSNAGALEEFQSHIESIIIGLKKPSHREAFRKAVLYGLKAAESGEAGPTDAAEAGSGNQDNGVDGGGGIVPSEAAGQGQQEAQGGEAAAGGEVAAEPAVVTASSLTDEQRKELGLPPREEAKPVSPALKKAQEEAIREISDLRDKDLLGEQDYRDAVDSILDSEDVEAVEDTADFIKSLANKKGEEDASDYDTAPDDLGDKDHAQSHRLIPDTPENASFNISRLKKNPAPPSSTANILGTISIEALRDQYPNLGDALKRIAKSGKGLSPAGLLAKAMSMNSALTGATLRMINDPNRKHTFKDAKTGEERTALIAGEFDSDTAVITINLAGIRDSADLHWTILHEVGHAYLDRIDMRFDKFPASLTSLERQTVKQLRQIAQMAKRAGLIWQQSDHESSRIQFREFVMAAMTDEKFQNALDRIQNPLPIDTKPSSLWQDFKNTVSRCYAGLMRLAQAVTGRSVSQSEEVDQSLLGATVDLFGSLVQNYNEITGLEDSLLGLRVMQQAAAKSSVRDVRGTSYRIVEGMVKDERDISVDKSNTQLAIKEAKQMMATTNEVDDALKQMLTAWTSSGRTHQQFVDQFLSGFFKGSIQNADEVRIAINDALSNGGGGTVSTAIGLNDLEQRGEAKRAAKDALRLLKTLQAAIAKEKATADRAFSKGTISNLIAASNQDLFELTKNYRDITRTQSAFVTELRRALNESEDTGIYSIAKALGLTTGRKAAIDAAVAKIQGNIAAYTDSLVALSELGLDFSQMKGGGLTPMDVSNAVAASSDPRLSAFQSSPAELAAAIMFARKRPLVMDLLAARGSGPDLLVLDKIIELATQDRPDAFDNAVKLVPKLAQIGRLGQRIATRVSEEKARNKKLMDRANRYLEVADFFKSSGPVLANRIRKLERMLGMEATVDQEQWAAVHGARYFVPENATDSEEKVFNKGRDNQFYKTLMLGEMFRFNEIQSDVFKMKAWLNANQSLAGTPNYELMARQVDRLTKIAGDGANYQIQRGPGGLVVTFLGDIATRAEFTGTQAGRLFAQQVRRFNTLYDAFMKGPEQREFLKFDGLLHEAQVATKTFGRDFTDRFYNRALGFLEARPDLIDPSLSTDAQLNKDMAEVMKHLSSDPAMGDPAAAAAVEKLLRQAIVNNDITQKNRQAMGLKVREEVHGRYVFREPIGVSQHAMSRGVNLRVRTLVQGFMATKLAWESDIADGSASLGKTLVADLYKNNRPILDAALLKRFTPRVMDGFVRPLVMKEGKSNFMGPEVGGVVDRAQRANVIDAFNMSGGDMIRFAEILHALEGGSAATLPDFVGSTLATFQNYYQQIRGVSSSMNQRGELVDDGFVLARSFLEARQGEDYPSEWLEYRTYGAQDNIRYTRMLAMQAAFGNNGGDAGANIEKMIEELGVLRGEYEVAMSKPNPAERDALLNAGGLKTARKNAARNLAEAEAVKAGFKGLTNTMNGVVYEQKVLMSMVGLLSGYTVQGAMTAFTDTVSMIETIFRKFGFSREAVSLIVGNLKNFTLEGVGSLFQAIGAQLHFNSQWQQQTKIINEGGLVDQDALIKNRFLKSFSTRYIEHLGDSESFASMWLRTKGAPMERASELVTGGAKRVSAVLRMGLDTGFGVAKEADSAYATFKPQAPFTWVNQLMHRAIARTWLSTVDSAVQKAEAYMRAHPASAADPAFKFNADNIQYSGRGLIGVSLDGKNFAYLVETLARNGITLEEAARRRLEGKPALTEEQVHSVISLAQTEILLNTSVTTRPAWSLNTAAGRMASPIIGWSLYRMTDLLKSTRNAKGQAEINAFKQAIIAFALGVIPASLAYAMLRDEWEEEVVGKKPNVLPLRADATLPMALLDNLSRVGTFGIAGDFANSMFNVTTGREFSIDSRVFFISSLTNIKNVVSTVYNQDGAMTYQTVWRPMLQSLGGSGYINNFDAINNLLDFDNAERRVVRRINVNNQLRAIGRVMQMDVRNSRGIQAMPNPMKPWVSQMVLAAYANDAAGFQEAYTKAVTAATKMAIENQKPDADPRADVAEAYQRAHPLRNVFNKAPTTGEYQKMLLELGDGATEVAAAIRMFNAYGAQIPRGRGKPGIEPFYGTDRSEGATRRPSYQSAAMRMPSTPKVPDYRRMTTAF